MGPFIPLWIIGAPFIGMLILSFSFKGASAMGGSLPRSGTRAGSTAFDSSAPLLDPVRPDAPRRLI